MSRLIIENRIDGLSDSAALKYASAVADEGKISGTGKGRQYCFHTEFKGGIHVSVFKNKKSERFVIYKGDDS